MLRACERADSLVTFLSNFVAMFRYQFAIECRCKTFVFRRNKHKKREPFSLYQPNFSDKRLFSPLLLFSLVCFASVCDLKSIFSHSHFYGWQKISVLNYDLFIVWCLISVYEKRCSRFENHHKYRSVSNVSNQFLLAH